MDEMVTRACGIAMGSVVSDPAEMGFTITAGKKDLNGKGRGDWWYRMVWRDGSWQYFSEERLPTGTYLAGDRRATVSGDVFLGELVCRHDKGGPVDAVWVVVGGDKPLRVCKYVKRRDGSLNVTLPDGSVVSVPNPRK